MAILVPIHTHWLFANMTEQMVDIIPYLLPDHWQYGYTC
jgi:hypothetical protein